MDPFCCIDTMETASNRMCITLVTSALEPNKRTNSTSTSLNSISKLPFVAFDSYSLLVNFDTMEVSPDLGTDELVSAIYNSAIESVSQHNSQDGTKPPEKKRAVRNDATKIE